MDDVTAHKIRDLKLKILQVEKEMAATQHRAGLDQRFGGGHAGQIAKANEREQQRLEEKLAELKSRLEELGGDGQAQPALAKRAAEPKAAKEAAPARTAAAKPAANPKVAKKAAAAKSASGKSAAKPPAAKKAAATKATAAGKTAKKTAKK